MTRSSLIAWPARIRRESPFLEAALADLPDRSVADLGCGTGEHARHFAALGFRGLGVRPGWRSALLGAFTGAIGFFGPWLTAALLARF